MEENVNTTMTKPCPFCMEQINIHAKKCRFCGEIIDVAMREIENIKRNQTQLAQQTSQPLVINNNNNNNNNNNDNNDNAEPVAASVTMVTQSVTVRHKSRFTYCILALFLGTLGVHNFYAGYNGRGIAQLLLTMSFLAAEAPEAVGVILIWVIIEMIITNRDSDGILLI